MTISGSVTAQWTSSVGGPQAFVYGGWLTNPAPDDVGAFGLNCYDKDFNIVGFSAVPGREVPMQPAVYDVTGADASISAEVALISDEGVWEPTSGTLEIAEFDETHIRGTFSLTIHDSFDSTRTAEISGDFAHTR